MLLTVLSTTVFSALALASPYPLHPRQTQSPSANITFTVTNFTAFMANPYIEGTQSNLSFHVVDTRPQYYAEADCTIPPTYFSLYAITALTERCGGDDYTNPFTFMFEDGLVAVTRTWAEGNKTYSGSASLNPYWTANGTSANVTVTPTGRLFSRKGVWMFPVSRLTMG